MKTECRTIDELISQKIPYSEMTEEEFKIVVEYEKEKSYNKGKHSEEVEIMRKKAAQQVEDSKIYAEKSYNIMKQLIEKSEKDIQKGVEENIKRD